jgi:hypothetical protein
MNPIQKSPQEIAEELVTLSEEYSRLSDESGVLEQESILHFVSIREKHKSDKTAERAYLATERGLRWVWVEKRLKGLSKQISALNAVLRHYENQGKNIY